MVKYKHIKQIHRGDLISDYLYEAFKNHIEFDEEVHDDFDIIRIGNGRADAEAISIKHLKEMIDELEKRGSTHVSIDFNCDHDEYELSGYSYLQLSTQELEEIEHKKLTDLEKIEKIRILERQIQDIQNGKS